MTRHAGSGNERWKGPTRLGVAEYTQQTLLLLLLLLRPLLILALHNTGRVRSTNYYNNFLLDLGGPSTPFPPPQCRVRLRARQRIDGQPRCRSPSTYGVRKPEMCYPLLGSHARALVVDGLMSEWCLRAPR